MKKLLVLYLFFCTVFCGCSSCGQKNASDGAAGTVVYHQFPTVHSPLSSDPKKEIVLGATAVYFEKESLKQELAQKEEIFKQVISRFGGTLSESDLRDVGRYEQARSSLRDLINKELRKGRIEKILFRTIEIR